MISRPVISDLADSRLAVYGKPSVQVLYQQISAIVSVVILLIILRSYSIFYNECIISVQLTHTHSTLLRSKYCNVKLATLYVTSKPYNVTT